MPKRTDLKSILIIGLPAPSSSGRRANSTIPCAQACKLPAREEGYKVILVNSNPATIMTDPDMADVTYIEADFLAWLVEKIIAKERPDALLPTMGGRPPLNCALDLAKHGVLEKYGVEMIGASKEAIDKAETAKNSGGDDQAGARARRRSSIAHSMEEALQVQAALGFPTIIRPSFTMGGSGGGHRPTNKDEFVAICERRPLESLSHDELLSKNRCLAGKSMRWRWCATARTTAIIVCSIENFDPMGGAHWPTPSPWPGADPTDKGIPDPCAMPASRCCARSRPTPAVPTVQFPPSTRKTCCAWVVIEMNPRVSPFLRAGRRRRPVFRLPRWRPSWRSATPRRTARTTSPAARTPASFRALDRHVVTKIPRFAFEESPAGRRPTDHPDEVGWPK